MNGMLLALLAGSAFLVSPGTDNRGVPREGWAGSPELPTAIAYYEFTQMLAEARRESHAYMHLIGDAFGVSDVESLAPESLGELARRGEMLVEHYTAMQLEIVESRMRIVCEAGPARRASPKAAYAALNASDDLSRPIQQKYLALTMAKLPEDQRRAFRSFLEEFKSSVTYLKFDNRPAEGLAGDATDGGAALDRACTTLHAEYARVLQDGGQ